MMVPDLPAYQFCPEDLICMDADVNRLAEWWVMATLYPEKDTPVTTVGCVSHPGIVGPVWPPREKWCQVIATEAIRSLGAL